MSHLELNNNHSTRSIITISNKPCQYQNFDYLADEFLGQYQYHDETNQNVLELIVSFIFKQDTQEEWRNVFYVCAGFTVFGAVVFGLFVSGEVEEWAKDKDDKLEDIEMRRRLSSAYVVPVPQT